MKNRQLEISQRDWDESIMEKRNPRWEGGGCSYCGDPFRMIEDDDGEYPCPSCNPNGTFVLEEE